MKILTFTSIFLVGFFVLFSNLNIVKAQSTSPTPETVSASVDSFSLFWPLVAGKTREDPLYKFKLFKEKVRGLLIFGSAQKADYKTYLSTKRALEAGDLIKRSKNDLANSTLDEFISNIDSASKSWQQAKSESNASDSIKENISKQLGNLDIFLNWLSQQASGTTKSKIDLSLSKVQDFFKSL